MASDPDRIHRDSATILTIIKYLLFIGISAAVIYFGFRIFLILIPFVIGLVLAKSSIALANVWHNAKNKILHRNIRGTRGLAPTKKDSHAAVVFYIMLVIAFIGLLVFVVLISISQLRSLANFLPTLVTETDYIERLVNYLADLSTRLGGIIPEDAMTAIRNALVTLQQRVMEAVPGIASSILAGLGNFLGDLPGLFMAIVVILMSGFYFITDSRSLYRFLLRNIGSRKFVRKSIRLIGTLSTTLFRVIGGYFLLLVITFVLALIGLIIIRMPYAVVIALVAAVVDFLPVLGISATMIPIAIYMFFNGHVWGGLGALIIWAVISFIRRLIEPPILGTAMSLHPMATLFSMIVGIAFYGISGVIIGPVVLVIFKEVFVQFELDKKLQVMLGDLLGKFTR